MKKFMISHYNLTIFLLLFKELKSKIHLIEQIWSNYGKMLSKRVINFYGTNMSRWDAQALDQRGGVVVRGFARHFVVGKHEFNFVSSHSLS